MTLRLTTCSKIFVAALAVAAVALLVGGPAQASNMGFKHNHIIYKNTGGGTIGNNYVALPYRNPYAVGQDICTTLNLPSTAKLQQINAASGAILSCPCGSNGCAGLTLLQNAAAPSPTRCPAPGTNNLGFNGILVTNVTGADTGGIIVGSHVSGQLCLPSTAGGGFNGVNYFPVPYHTTAVNAQNLCDQPSPVIGATGKVSRTNAQTGAVLTCPCGGCAALSLVLGEAVTITDSTGHVFAPAHF